MNPSRRAPGPAVAGAAQRGALDVLVDLCDRVRSGLPAGTGLPQEVWDRRHRWLTALLVAGLVGVTGYVPSVDTDALMYGWVPPVVTVWLGAICVVAVLPWRRLTPGAARRLRSCATAYGAMATAIWLLGLSNGEPQAFFVLFVLVPLVALYEAWSPFLVALGLVAFEIGVIGTVVPHAVYGHRHGPGAGGALADAALHGALFLLAGTASLVVWRDSERSRRRGDAVVAQLQHQARHDELTGLLNRAGLVDVLGELLGGTTGPSAPVAVVVMDLNRFKEVNDTLGHTAGDELLRSVAQVMARTIGASGMLARLGGDEFALVVSGADAVSGAAAAQRLREEVRERSRVAGVALDVDLSAGVAVHPGGEVLGPVSAARVVEELLRHGDIAMYASKAAGGGVTAYSRSFDHHSTERLEVAHELRRAVDRDDELVLHFQPQVALSAPSGSGSVPSLRLVGVEALVRWQHPTRGFMPPSDFIPLLEATDLVHAFTHRMIALALDQARVWLDAGFEVPVAVNAFPRCLTHPDFVQQVLGALHARSLPPRLLRLEITEDALVADPEAAAAVITELREAGVATSIDDFGTGYSSLSYLRRLPVDEVKLDRSYVTGLGAQAGADGAAAADEVLVSSIIDLAHRLGMKVVAEGIEEQQETDVLRSLGCDVGQGYLYARPLPAAQLPEALLETSRVQQLPRQRRLGPAGAPTGASAGVSTGASTGESTGPAEVGLGASSG